MFKKNILFFAPANYFPTAGIIRWVKAMKLEEKKREISIWEEHMLGGAEWTAFK